MTEKDYMNQRSSPTEPVTEQLGQSISNVTQQAGAKVSQLTDQAKQTVTSQVSTQKDKATETLTSVADALRQTGSQLNTDDKGAIGEYVNKAADQVERLSTFLRERNINDIIYETEQFARRQPAAFLGGAFVLGLLGARFLKSSNQNNQNSAYNQTTFNRYPSVPSYQQRQPMTGRGYGPNYNPANNQPSRITTYPAAMTPTGATADNERAQHNASIHGSATQASTMGNQQFGTTGEREDR